MFSWWDSLDSITSFNKWMQLFVAVFGIITAICTFLLWFSGNRMAALQSIKEAQAQQRLHAAETSTEDVRKELTEEQKRRMEAERELHERVEGVQKRQQPRTLTSDQQE